MRPALAILLLVAWACVAIGCGEAPQPGATPSEPETTDADALTTEATRGPVTVRLRVAPKAPLLSDVVTVDVTIESDDGVDVELPSMHGSLGAFTVRDFDEGLPAIDGDRRVRRMRYTVEPLATGAQLVRPVRVRFTTGEGDARKRHTVATEPLKVEVRVASDDAKPDLAAIEGPRGLVDVPAPLLPFAWWWLLVGGGVVVLAVALWWWRLRRRGPPPERRYTPEELAYLEMQELIAADLVAKRDYSGFYVELTGIVRRYIERTTDIHAPEQTTEEFLAAMRSRDDFALERQQRLADFLEAADLIKFAGQIPGADEIEASFDRAKAFVGLAERERAA